MFSLSEPPLFTRLRDARRVLVAGAGGGFDIYAGIPLALALRNAGKEVHLANLTFSDLSRLTPETWVKPGVAAIDPSANGSATYFPERVLAEWLASENLPSTVYAFPRVGVKPLRIAYRNLVSLLSIDAIVLVDGGTDILMRGDEVGLGTPEEDMTSLAAVAGIDEVPERLVACIGFGIDFFHGVCHSHVLENLAALERAGAYLGAFSIPSASVEAAAYQRAVAYAQSVTPRRPSIVNGQIAAALRGEFGNSQFTDRTAGSELFVNPLMSVYFTVDLPGLARAVGYLSELGETIHMAEVSLAIKAHREDIDRRTWRAFPH